MRAAAAESGDAELLELLLRQFIEMVEIEDASGNCSLLG